MTPGSDARSTIFALSSGRPPAGVAVVRISGPRAAAALQTAIGGALPAPRRAVLRSIVHPETGTLLDRALTLWFPGPGSATGEDLAELHLHGGRAVVAAVLDALATIAGLQPAEPGAFTRRAFENGRIDLSEAEGLADLLAAETEAERANALRMADGGLSRQVAIWQQAVLDLAARVEALIDFSDEDDVGEEDADGLRSACSHLAAKMIALNGAPPAERLRDGVRVVIGGPTNAGKSTLLNALAGRDAALVSSVAGTTRDLIEAPVSLGGLPLLLTDTAGLRDRPGEAIEAMGIERAAQTIAGADILLWLGPPIECPAPDRALILHARADERPVMVAGADFAISVRSGEGMDRLRSELLARARALLPAPDVLAINGRQRAALADAADQLSHAAQHADWLLVAEHLRLALAAFDRLTGRAGTEQMLDALFGRFCIGK